MRIIIQQITNYALFVKRLKREENEKQQKVMLEKRANFREATKNLLVFAQEDMEVKEKKSKKKVEFLLESFCQCRQNLI